MHPSPQPPHKERVPRLNRQVVCRPLTRFQARSAHAQAGLRGEGYQFIPHLQFFHAHEAVPRNIEGMAGSDQKIFRASRCGLLARQCNLLDGQSQDRLVITDMRCGYCRQERLT